MRGVRSSDKLIKSSKLVPYTFVNKAKMSLANRPKNRMNDHSVLAPFLYSGRGRVVNILNKCVSNEC